MSKLQQGKSYLILGSTANIFPKLKTAFEFSLDTNILLVSRDIIDKVWSKTKKNVRVIWLSNIETNTPHTHPAQVEQLTYDIECFMRKNKSAVVILAASDYLISFNSFKEFLRMIQQLRDIAAVTKSLLIICKGTKTLEEHEENMLKEELLVGDCNA